MIKSKEHALKQTDNGKARSIFTNIQGGKGRTSKTVTTIRVWFKRFKDAPTFTAYQSPVKRLGRIRGQSENFPHF
jgi:hypothetical protein